MLDLKGGDMGRWCLEYFYTPRTAENIDKMERMEVPLKSMTEEGAIREAQELWAAELARATVKREKNKKTSDDVFKYRPFNPHVVYRHAIGI